MDSLLELRQSRLKAFLKERRWQVADLVIFAKERRTTLNLGFKTDLQSELDQVQLGKKILSAATACELSVYMQFPVTDLLGHCNNGEQEEVNRVSSVVLGAIQRYEAANGSKHAQPDDPQVAPDLSRPLKALRSEALHSAMKAKSMSLTDVTRALHPRSKKERKMARRSLDNSLRGHRLLKEEEIVALAGLLEVPAETLRIRAPSEREQRYLDRAAVAAQSRKPKRGRKSRVSSEETPEVPRPKRAAREDADSTTLLDVDPVRLGNAVIEIDELKVTLEGQELVIRLPWTNDLLIRLLAKR